MTKAFVVGWPIAHSRSPLIHGFWLKRHGIAGTYERIAVPPEEFARFIAGLPASGFAGGNVTLPHKEAAFRLVEPGDELSLKIVRDGKESHQGVGYLEDGTMVVVDGAHGRSGERLAVTITGAASPSG